MKGLDTTKAIVLAALTAMMFGLLVFGCASTPAQQHTFQPVADNGWPYLGWATND